MVTAKQALLNAADWLEANPDKHIGGDLAVKSNGRMTWDLTDPDIVCFCAIGRIGAEFGITDDRRDYHLSIYEEIWSNINTDLKDGTNFADVYIVNDAAEGYIQVADTEYPKGDPKVIPYLRELAAKIPG